MKKLLSIAIAILFTLSLTSCTSDKDFEKGKRMLEAQGFTNVINTGHNYFCCDDKDSFSTGFKATAKDGTTIKGCFCSSLFKGVTIRYE